MGRGRCQARSQFNNEPVSHGSQSIYRLFIADARSRSSHVTAALLKLLPNAWLWGFARGLAQCKMGLGEKIEKGFKRSLTCICFGVHSTLHCRTSYAFCRGTFVWGCFFVLLDYRVCFWKLRLILCWVWPLGGAVFLIGSMWRQIESIRHAASTSISISVHIGFIPL